VLSLLGGAAVGAVAMYLMDPNHGDERRARALETAHRALEAGTVAARTAYHGTADALGHAWEAASEKAGEAGSAAYAAMPSTKDVRKGGERMLDRVYDAGSNLRDTAGSWMDSARNMLPRSAHLERHSDYAMNPAGVSATALGALALGAGAMWLFDAARGRGRRAWIGQKATHFMHEIGSFGRATGRHLRNKAKGYYYETSSAVRDRAQDLAGTVGQ